MLDEQNQQDAANPNANGSSKPKGGISRRGFLRGAGLTTAGTVMLKGAVLGEAGTEATDGPVKLGPESIPVHIVVNGIKRKVHIEPRTTLAEALRVHMGLTGTKVVCDRGSCSACTVWVDRKPVNSCMTLALDVADREITTVEGIARNGVLHPVQEAFIEHDASMCGYCTPGMIMSSVHLVETHPNPAFDDVRHALRGNVCRCGTYPKVFTAVIDAAEKMKK